MRVCGIVSKRLNVLCDMANGNEILKKLIQICYHSSSSQILITTEYSEKGSEIKTASLWLSKRDAEKYYFNLVFDDEKYIESHKKKLSDYFCDEDYLLLVNFIGDFDESYQAVQKFIQSGDGSEGNVAMHILEGETEIDRFYPIGVRCGFRFISPSISPYTSSILGRRRK